MFLKESKLGVLSLSLTGAEEFGAVLAAQSDDSHAGCNCRDNAAEQPQLLEECRSGERSSAAILGHQGASDIHGQDSVNPAVLLFAAKKLKSNMDILHSFSPFFTPQDWFDAPCFMICNKTAKSVAQRAKKTEKDLCGIFLTIVIYYLQ